MCRVTPDLTTVLPSSSGAPAEARGLVAAVACTRHHARIAHASALVVSELVTNALVHGLPPICLRLRCDEETGLEISVGDGDRRLPERRAPPAHALGGRGVLLVDTLSASWGVTRTLGGKVVWSRLQ